MKNQQNYFLRKLFFLLLTLFCLLSCTTKKQTLYLQNHKFYSDIKIYNDNYTIQVDDILRITVGTLAPEAAIPFNKTNSGSVVANNIEILRLDGYLVTQNLTINFPVLGELSVKDKTPKDLEYDIKTILKENGYLIEPNVTVRLINAKVTILGEVQNAGTFTFTDNKISLLQALGLAGDLTINGSREDVLVLRYEDGVQTTNRIDLTSASFLGGPNQMVKPNDVIIVNPNSAKVSSAGYVGNLSAILGIASIVLSSIILLTR